MARLQHCPHSSHERAPGSTREVHVDYCFFRNGRGQETIPVVVLKERDSKAIAAHVVPFKGANHDWTIDQCLRDLKKWGLHGDLIIRSDQEDALKD